jgi:ssDNA-binding Zn-finger/Zn-ribbon topoisomerase 1
MSELTYRCPKCGSDSVFSTHEQAFMVNTCDHYCHMVKPQDPNAKAGCLNCRWQGERQELVGERA